MTHSWTRRPFEIDKTVTIDIVIFNGNFNQRYSVEGLTACGGGDAVAIQCFQLLSSNQLRQSTVKSLTGHSLVYVCGTSWPSHRVTVAQRRRFPSLRAKEIKTNWSEWIRDEFQAPSAPLSARARWRTVRLPTGASPRRQLTSPATDRVTSIVVSQRSPSSAVVAAKGERAPAFTRGTSSKLHRKISVKPKESRPRSTMPIVGRVLQIRRPYDDDAGAAVQRREAQHHTSSSSSSSAFCPPTRPAPIRTPDCPTSKMTTTSAMSKAASQSQTSDEPMEVPVAIIPDGARPGAAAAAAAAFTGANLAPASGCMTGVSSRSAGSPMDCVRPDGRSWCSQSCRRRDTGRQQWHRRQMERQRSVKRLGWRSKSDSVACRVSSLTVRMTDCSFTPVVWGRGNGTRTMINILVVVPLCDIIEPHFSATV